jgi:hypothetical protein
MYWNALAWWNTSVAVQPVSDTAEREIEIETEIETVADFCFESLSCFELSDCQCLNVMSMYHFVLFFAAIPSLLCVDLDDQRVGMVLQKTHHLFSQRYRSLSRACLGQLIGLTDI